VTTQARANETVYDYGAAKHMRLDFPDGSKRMWWEPAGVPMHTLPLWNADLLDEHRRKRPDEPVLLVEGEKAADAAVRCGFTAVSFPGGASQRNFGTAPEALRGLKTALIPDLDDPGSKLMDAAATAVSKEAVEVRRGSIATILDKKGADIADLLEMVDGDERAARELIQAIVEDAEPYAEPPQPTVAEVSELGDALPLWEMAEPPPREWLVDNFIPDRWPTLLYGDGGAGKTTLVTHLALHIATGREWFGRLVKQANVLIVDAELDEIEAARRTWPLARGMSLDAPPPGVYYWRLPKALSGEDILNHLHEMVVKRNIGFVIVDSLTIATHLSDQNVSSDLLKLIFSLQKWGVPFLFIDHHAKSALNGDPDSTSPYGSVYKRNAVRSMTFMQTGVKGSARLHCRKSNFGPKWEPFSIGADWIGVYPNQAIVYSRLADNDPRNLEMKSEEVKNETLEALRVLADEYPEGVPTKAVAEYVAITEDTARMRLGRLEKMRPPQASRPDRGKWLPINEPPPPEPNR